MVYLGGQLCVGNSDAVSRFKNGKLSIIYNDKVNPIGRINFSIMVEIAHHLLYHKIDNQQTEQEAMMLAIRILAPMIVIYKCNIKSADEISQMCAISLQAAKFRLERLNNVKSRNMFLTHPLEVKLYEQFKPYIQSYEYKCK